MRRVTSSTSALLSCAGAVRSVLSRMRVTSAELRAGRLPEPEKITSSMPEARMALYELSPITQRMASTRLDLPQPLGPTMPVRPGSMTSVVSSQKLLKPWSLRRENFICRDSWKGEGVLGLPTPPPNLPLVGRGADRVCSAYCAGVAGDMVSAGA